MSLRVKGGVHVLSAVCISSRGELIIKQMKLKLQDFHCMGFFEGPGGAVSMCSHSFVKFTKLRYFSHSLSSPLFAYPFT